MNDLIPVDQHFLLFFILVGAAFIGIVGEYKKWFGKISGAIITITIGALCTSLNVIPSASDQSLSVPTYNFVYGYVIPFSIPLLLFSTNIINIIKQSGKLLVLFLIGSIGVCLGAVLGHLLLDLGDQGYKLAGVFIGTYTGGSVNFMSVAAAFDFLSDPLFATAVVVDNTFTNLYFLLIFSIPGITWIVRRFSPVDKETDVTADPEKIDHVAVGSLVDIISVLFIASFCCAVGYFFGPMASSLLNTDINLDILVITLVAVALVNMFPAYFSRLDYVAFPLGMALMFIFLATIGAACDLIALIQSSVSTILFATIILVVHLVIILIAGRLLKMNIYEIVIASLANVGGPSISAPAAASYGMKRLVTPAILIAVLGYVIGTVLGVVVGALLQ